MPIPVPLLALLAGPAVITVADGVPRFPIAQTCRAAQPLTSDDKTAYQGCMKDEAEARADLQKRWSTFKPGNRSTCVQETTVGGLPSYVEVLTCLQMYEAAASSPSNSAPAKAVPSAAPDAAGTPAPRKPAAGRRQPSG